MKQKDATQGWKKDKKVEAKSNKIPTQKQTWVF